MTLFTDDVVFCEFNFNVPISLHMFSSGCKDIFNVQFGITEPAEIICNQVVFLAAGTLNQNNSFFIGLLGELLGGTSPTHLACVLHVKSTLNGSQLLGVGDVWSGAEG